MNHDTLSIYVCTVEITLGIWELLFTSPPTRDLVRQIWESKPAKNDEQTKWDMILLWEALPDGYLLGRYSSLGGLLRVEQRTVVRN